jgi:hypothetical protein
VSESDSLTSVQIYRIIFDVQAGEANPDDARRLLAHFCNCIDKGERIHPRLLRHLRDSFRAYLDDRRTLESALGLVKKKGRPKADENTRIQMAAEVLRRRLGGMSHQDALCEVALMYEKKSESIIGEAWAEWAEYGLHLLRLERPQKEYPWLPEEVERLIEIFGNKSWLIKPGEEPWAPEK